MQLDVWWKKLLPMAWKNKAKRILHLQVVRLSGRAIASTHGIPAISVAEDLKAAHAASSGWDKCKELTGEKMY